MKRIFGNGVVVIIIIVTIILSVIKITALEKIIEVIKKLLTM